jgi:transposase
MQAVTIIGLDIAKSVFQIHGVDAAGNVIVRRRFKRRYVLPFFQKLPPSRVNRGKPVYIRARGQSQA